MTTSDINVKRRHKKNSKEALTGLISFRVSDPMQQHITSRLEEGGLGVGEYLRELITRDMTCQQKST